MGFLKEGGIMLEEITGLKHFEEIKRKTEFFIVVFYTENSEKSKQVVKILEEVKKESKDVAIFSVNASKVKDIHPVFGITTVPTVIVIKKGELIKIIYGVQNKQYYQMLLYEAPLKEGEKRKFKKVIVYTSPSCPWCSTVKSYLRQHGIPFREVDISKDEREAERLVRKSGQMGVPQTEINGKIVVGFDKNKLDSLLGINK